MDNSGAPPHLLGALLRRALRVDERHRELGILGHDSARNGQILPRHLLGSWRFSFGFDFQSRLEGAGSDARGGWLRGTGIRRVDVDLGTNPDHRYRIVRIGGTRGWSARGRTFRLGHGCAAVGSRAARDAGSTWKRPTSGMRAGCSSPATLGPSVRADCWACTSDRENRTAGSGGTARSESSSAERRRRIRSCSWVRLAVMVIGTVVFGPPRFRGVLQDGDNQAGRRSSLYARSRGNGWAPAPQLASSSVTELWSGPVATPVSGHPARDRGLPPRGGRYERVELLARSALQTGRWSEAPIAARGSAMSKLQTVGGGPVGEARIRAGSQKKIWVMTWDAELGPASPLHPLSSSSPAATCLPRNPLGRDRHHGLSASRSLQRPGARVRPSSSPTTSTENQRRFSRISTHDCRGRWLDLIGSLPPAARTLGPARFVPRSCISRNSGPRPALCRVRTR
jgi:hypothetical protein